MKQEQITIFESLQVQLNSLYNEVQVLVKKSPNDGMNKFKLKLINTLLSRANSFFQQIKSDKPFEDFLEFCEEEIPSNSDVLFIISQYIACMEKLRADNITYYSMRWYWIVDGKKSDILTAPPKKISD